MNKKIIVGISIFLLLLTTVNADYVSDHNNCPTSYQSQNCLGITQVCRYSSSVVYCDLPANVNAEVPGSSTTINSNNYNAGLGGGYVYDCTQDAADCTDWDCQRDTVCYTTRHRQTTCLPSQRAGSGEGISFNCGNCLSGYNDCDSDGIVCEIRNTDSCGTNAEYSGCSGPVGNCVCEAGFNDCDGTGPGVGNGCEIEDGSACMIDGASGTYSGCNGAVGQCVPSKSYFETGTLATYLTNQSLLWGKNLGSGFLMNLSNGTGLEFKINNNACIVFPDGSTQCTSASSEEIGDAAGWSSDGSTTNTSQNVRMGEDGFYYNSVNERVGLGTLSPSANLHINSSLDAEFKITSITNAFMTIQADGDNDNTNDAYLGLYESGTWRYSLGYDGSNDIFSIDSGDLDDVNFFTIGSTGNVGIGTLSPNEKLTVNGNVSLNNALFVNAAGNVGIGNANPGEKLHVSGQINATDFCVQGGLCLSDAGTGSGDITDVGSVTAGAAFNSASADDQWLGLGAAAGRIEFDDQATDEVNFLDANVGIGTNNPNATLHVDGTINVTEGNDICIDGGNCLGQINVNGASSSAGWYNDSQTTNTDLDVNITTGNLIIPNGNVGIGTNSPVANLHIQSGTGTLTSTGNELIINRTGGASALIASYMNSVQVGSLDSSNLSFRTNNIDQMTITTDGNVGIGTTGPNETLHVAGNIYVTSANDVCIEGGQCLGSFSPNGGSMSAGWFNSSSTTSTFLIVNISNGPLYVQGTNVLNNLSTLHFQVVNNATALENQIALELSDNTTQANLINQLRTDLIANSTLMQLLNISNATQSTLINQLTSLELLDNTTQAILINALYTALSNDMFNLSAGATNYVYSTNNWLGNNTFYNTDSENLQVNGSLRLQNLFGITKIFMNGTNGKIIADQTDILYNLSELRKDIGSVNGTMGGSYYNQTESDSRFVNAAGDSMTGDLSMGDNAINNVSDPLDPQDVATKNYTDALVAGLNQDKITEDNSAVEVYDTGSNGKINFTTEGQERMMIGPDGTVYIYGNLSLSGDMYLGNVTGDGSNLTNVGATFVGLTSSSLTGNLAKNAKVGYQAGNEICNANYTGSHLCTQSEIMRSIDLEDISTFGDWVSPNTAWINAGGAKYAPAALPVNDCNGWTHGAAGDYLGSFWKFEVNGGGSGAVIHCGSTKPLACCK